MSPKGTNRRRGVVRARWSLPAAALLIGPMGACSDNTSEPRIADRVAKPLAVESPSGGGNRGLFTGRYVVRHGDDFEHDHGTFDPMLEVDDSTILALDFGKGHKPNLDPGARVRVRGMRTSRKIVVEDGSTEVDTPDSPFSPFPSASLSQAGSSRDLTSSTIALAPTTKRVAVILFNFSNNQTQPYTTAFAAGVAFNDANSVAAYYQSNSWGGVSLVGNVYGWFTIPDSATSACDFMSWAVSANKLAAAAGIDLSSASYDHIVYGFPSVADCGFSGLAFMPGRQAWLNGSAGMSLRTMAHELGHNFGTDHASALNCIVNGARVPLAADINANCTRSEYGDPFSVMGSGTHRHTNLSLANFRWLPVANRLDVNTSGDYHLDPLYASAGTEALRIQRSTGSYLTLEFRQSGPFDSFSSSDPAVNGVTVRISGSDGSPTQSLLLDMTSATTSFGDAALPVGRSFVDPVTGVAMTTLGVSSAGADVRISFVPDTSAPTEPTGLTATANGSKITLSWKPSTDDVGVVGYRLYKNGKLQATTTGTVYIDVFGGGKKPSAAYYVVAFDAAGNVSTQSTTILAREAADGRN